MDLGKIGEFISILRKENNLTQEQLGKKIGVTGKVVSKWEHGVCAPNISLLNDLSEALGVTTTELLNGRKIEKISQKDMEVATTETVKYYNQINKKNFQKKLVLIIAGILLVAIIIFGVLFFKNNYHNCYIYSISSSEKKYNVEGFLVLSPNNEILAIHSIENIMDLESFEIKAYSYEYSLYLSDIELFREGNISLYEHQKGDQLLTFEDILSKIRVYETENTKYDEIIKGNRLQEEKIKLKITYLDQKMEIQEKVIMFQLKEKYVNNQIFYNGGNNF